MSVKNLFLIGRFNTITQSMNEYLSKYFHVQLCSDNREIIKGMLTMSPPDLVIISLIGLDKAHAGIFSELKHNHSTIPCICLGTVVEQEPFGQYFRIPQFRALTRPVSNSDLLNAVCEKLKLEIDAAKDQVIEPKKGHKHILLIDDNPIQLRVLKGMMPQNYDVTMSLSCAEALVAIGKRIPDLIFLDYEMPVCDGKMTLEMIRNIEEAKNVPVVFLTGVRDKEHIKAVLDLKPAGYILKPTTNETIYSTVERILEKK